MVEYGSLQMRLGLSSSYHLRIHCSWCYFRDVCTLWSAH